MDLSETFANGIIKDNIPEEEKVKSSDQVSANKDNVGNWPEGSELSFKEVPVSQALIEKAKSILDLLNRGTEIPIETLRSLAKSEGGFVNDEVRKIGWLALLQLDLECSEPVPSEESLKEHPEYAQVVLDVNRSLRRFPPGIPYEQRLALQDQLTYLILRVITKYPHLRYYQGYHDVAVTFLLVVGENSAFRIMEKLSTGHLKDCMEPTMEKTSYLLNYIFPLIERLNPRLEQFIEKSGVGTMFCLPWFLTWYGHSLNHYKDVVRLYDFFLAMHPLTPLYLAAVIVAYRSEEVFATDCDMASVHCLLSQLPDDLPFEKLIVQATELIEQFPPESVERDVIERTQREKEERKREEALALARRKARLAATEKGLKWQISKIFPTSKTQILLFALSMAIGLYAYWKGGADNFPNR